MNARDLLAAATPRPWTDTANNNRYGSVASTDPAAIEAFCARHHDGHLDVEAYGGALVGESIQPADRALIVAAVNEYGPLNDIRAAAREAVNMLRHPLASLHDLDVARKLEASFVPLDEVRRGA